MVVTVILIALCVAIVIQMTRNEQGMIRRSLTFLCEEIFSDYAIPEWPEGGWSTEEIAAMSGPITSSPHTSIALGALDMNAIFEEIHYLVERESFEILCGELSMADDIATMIHNRVLVLETLQSAHEYCVDLSGKIKNELEQFHTRRRLLMSGTIKELEYLRSRAFWDHEFTIGLSRWRRLRFAKRASTGLE